MARTAPQQLRLDLWVQIVRTFSRVQRVIVQALAAQEMTLPQFDLLATLRFNDGTTQQELAERLFTLAQTTQAPIPAWSRGSPDRLNWPVLPARCRCLLGRRPF